MLRKNVAQRNANGTVTNVDQTVTPPVGGATPPAPVSPTPGGSPTAPVDPVAPVDTGIDANKVMAGGQQNVTPPSDATKPSDKVVTPTDPSKPVDVKFGQDANALSIQNPGYQETRNKQIADSVKAQLQNIANSGINVDDTIRDKALTETLAQFGATPNWSDPNWQHTINDIYGKAAGTQKWQDIYSGVNSKSAVVNKFTNGSQVLDAVRGGQLSQNQMNTIKTYNPNLYNDYIKAKDDQLKLDTVNVVSGETPKNSPLKDVQDMLTAAGFTTAPTSTITSADDLLAKRNEMLNTPEIKTAQDNYLATKQAYTTIQDTYSNIEADVRKEKEGTGATESLIIAEATKRQKELQPALQKAYRDATFAQEDYSLQLGNAKENFTAYTDALKMQKTDEQNALQNKSMYLSAIGQAYNIYNQTPEGQKQKMQLEYDFNNPSLNSTDPVEVNRAINNSITEQMKTLTAMGVPFQQSSSQIIAKVQSAVKGGMSVQDAIEENFMKGVREKPQWQALSKKVDDKTTWGVIGQDPDTGANIYGFIDLANKTVDPWKGSSTSSISFPGGPVLNAGVTKNYDFSNLNNPYFRTNSTKDAGLNNNNPGNLRAGDVGNGISESGFTIYATPQDGWNALVNQVYGNQTVAGTNYNPNMTLSQYFAVYAPKGDGNNPTTYAQDVATQLGVATNTQIKNVDTLALAKAISSHESKGMYSVLFGAGNSNLKKEGDTPNIVSITAADQGGADSKAITDGYIAQFNSSNYNPQTDKNKARVQQYYAFQQSKNDIQSDPNSDIYELMRLSRGQKALTESPSKQYKDIGIVTDKLDHLYDDITNAGGGDLAPLNALIRNNNPWDTKAQAIKADLQAITPKVARGIFGEVGVLTDQDIKNYIQTIPNISQTADVRDVIMLAMLDTVKSSLGNAVRVDSATYNTAGMQGYYKLIDDKVTSLRAKVTGGQAPNGNIDPAQWLSQFNFN